MKYIVDVVLSIMCLIGLVVVYLAVSDVAHADSICYWVDNLMVCTGN